MLKRLLWTIVALVLIATIAFGAYCLYQKTTGGNMPFANDSVTTNSTSNVTEQPVVNQIVVTEEPKVTEVPATEAPKVTEVPSTEEPKVTEIPATEVPQPTEAPKQQPVLVTELPLDKVVAEEIPNTKVKLLVNSSGNVFAITEKRRDKVEKTIEVDENAINLRLQNGYLKYSVEAWRSEEEYITGDVVDYDVKLTEVFTTVEEALDKTKMKDDNGYTHRLFDESKPGKLIVRIKFEYNDKTYFIEVWLQDELFTLREYGEKKSSATSTPPPVTEPPVTEPPATSTPPPVTESPAPSHNPDPTPTPTPPAPSHNPDPTPTPTPPAPSHNPDLPPTPSHNPDPTTGPSHNPDGEDSNGGKPEHNDDGNNNTQSTATPPPVNENGDTLVEPDLVLPPK